ncbi:MAG: enoyl-CoA hydratase/isomerase family protein [Proteobacteria bacterium]|nr:enoyl-CoA hydratase/isomerase family protein [Pseudomonadota bacterium]MBU1740899.1 enoyl-CoA hydratase/isomerase family protein [Pseudomonadota bacterium]
MAYETIKYRKEQKLAFITLDRPKVLNALNGRMLEEIKDAVENLAADPEVVVGVVDSACDRGFSSGIDVAYVKDMDSWGARRMGQLLHETFGTCRFIGKPLVASIHGLCLGAGLELALSCDILIAAEDARFGLPNINVGIPAIVEAAILPAAVGIFATKELCFTGEFWDVARADKFNLLNAIVPRAELEQETLRWAEKIASKSPRGLETQKDIINKWMTTDLETAIDFSINTVGLNWATRDQKEGMGAFVEKRDAHFTGE